MKKISNKRNIFSKIIRLFDKWIITPITKLILIISDFFKDNGKGLEKALTNRQSLVVLSLVAALITFFVIDNKFTSLTDSSAEVLYGQKVKAIYNEEAFVVEGLPESVDVMLIGRKWDVYLAKQYPADEVVVDLTGLSAGQHKVNLKYQQSVSSVQYKLDVTTATVVIHDKISENREVSTDIIHKDSLNTQLNIDSVNLSKDNVIIKGASYKLAEVASVKALIDVDNISKQEVGTQTLKDVNLVAYDKNGNIVDVEIVPSKIEAVIKITSPSKVVPIKVIPDGELDGKSIRSITTSVTNVTIYGSEEALQDIEYLPVKIDVSGVSSDKTYTVNLTNPTGVRETSVKTITIKLTVDEIISKEIENMQITITNLEEGYKAQALSQEYSKVTVIVSGSKSVLDTLDPTKVTAYIDLSGKKEGEHEVQVKATGEDTRLTYKSRVKNIKVRITKK